MNEETEVIKADEFGLDQKQVGQVDLAFAEKVEERKLLSEVYATLIKKDITEEVAQEARQLRLRAVKVKSGIAEIHKTQKEYALAFGKYCDAWKRKETEPVQQIIDGANEIEKFEERQRQLKLQQLQSDREEKLSVYFEDAQSMDLSGMNEDVWIAYFESKKKQYEERIAAEKKAEEERIAKEKEEEAERKRIKKENERLKKEAEENARLAKIEADKREKALKKEREDHERELKKQRDEKQRIENEERAKREALEAKIKAKEDAERKAKEDEQKRIQAELKKGDSAKVEDLIADLKALKTKYSFKSAANKNMYSNVSVLIDKVVQYIKS